MIKIMLFTVFTIVIAACSSSTIYIVRHAEKADDGRDPDLSTNGASRAVALKDFLASKRINKIFVTNYKRTQQTAAPLAQTANITPSIIPAGSLPALIDSLKMHPGKNILIVGHSNTVPMIVDSLMKQPQHISIAENDFDNLFIVTSRKRETAKRKLTKSTYGIATP